MTHDVSGVSPGAEPIEDLPVCTLVSRAQTGSLSSFAELVARFEGRLFNFLLRRTRCVADAEDLAQDTFVRAWQRIRRYDPRWRFSTWLFTIAHRLAVTHQRRRRSLRSLTRLAGRAPAEVADPARVIADREQCRLLWDVADRILGETQRTALWLRYAEDLTPGEIARVLGKPRIAVRVMLHRAREALAGEAARAGRRRETVAALEKKLAGDWTC